LITHLYSLYIIVHLPEYVKMFLKKMYVKA